MSDFEALEPEVLAVLQKMREGETFARGLQVELDWIDATPTTGPAIRRFIERSLEMVAAQVEIESGSSLPWPTLDPDEFIPDHRFTLGVHAAAGTKRLVRSPLDAAGWQRLLDRVQSNEVSEFRFDATRPFLTGGEGGSALGTIDFDTNRVSRHEAHYVALRLTRPGRNVRIADIQNDALETFTAAARELDAVFGVVTYDVTAMRREFDNFIDASDGRRGITDRARSWAWATLLSAGHLQRIGGPDMVIRTAPAYRVTDLSDGASQRVLLQWTPSIDEVDSTARMSMREYFGPILTAA
jgi:hypothetical protein